MSTFLFYNPNSNPSRYSQKARFSKRQSVLPATDYSASNTELYPQINRTSASCIYPAQSGICDNYDLQPADPARTTTFESTCLPNQDDGTFSERDISDVESLRSLFFGTEPGASVSFPEVGEVTPSSSPKNTLSASCGDELVPVNEDACITQPDSCPDRQGPVCNSDQLPEAFASAPDLATYCSNLSPSPTLRAQDFVIADDHATSHQSDLICPLGADDPKNPAESVDLWDSSMQCTILNVDEMQVDAENEGTSNNQCSVRLAPDFCQRPEITSLELTEKSTSSSPCYSNELDSAGENANGSIPDPEIRPITLAEETCPFGPDNTTSLQLHIDRETEDSAPIIAEGRSESSQEPPTVHAAAYSGMDAQGHASAEPSTPREPIADPPIVLADTSFASDKPTPARSPLRISSHQGRRKRFAEFSHVEIPTRPLAEAHRPSVEVAPTFDQPDRSCHPPLTNGPWRLDGTILSIDIRDAEQIPIFVGYSGFRVRDGNLTQSLTFFQGLADGSPIEKPACMEGKRSPSCTSARGPLSFEQKRRLVQLKEEGYTWDEIVHEFPGRKRNTLQAICSAASKRLRSSGSIHNRRTRSSLSVHKSSLNERSLREVTGNARLKHKRTNQTKKSQYNLRARGSQ
ncbi:hypothetical protein ASPSYDRAFT_96117 [Aspergillus sydowii CBS 593.65]|uniref:Myb-like domain-containing protein n=1 Tax=Aspergillus sydowii CBS 593.65 TaxID=1036612 RepID=A0A1L9SXD1_9EURO|nr:uncharacterized protein ASPSYDRAFT_96117 [Aspergillus sydowii CBS 593.65]OJJ51844.1 hypothetical protein ASPSYDRAFT_96117 [Aspergillus sydowii CBS 593.65]